MRGGPLLALALVLAGPAAGGEAAAATMAASATTAAPATMAAPATETTLRVGVPAGPDAEAGFDRSLFAEAAREAGLGVVFDVMPPAAALAALDAGRIDVAAGPYRPAAGAGLGGGRRALAALAPDGDALLKRRGDGSVKLPADAAGKALGLLGPVPTPVPPPVPASPPSSAASAARLRAEALALGARVAAPPRAFADPLGALAAGRLAVLIGGLPEVAAAALARPDAVEVVGLVAGGDALVAVARGEGGGRGDLADRVAAALGRMRADGRLAAVQRRWFGVALAPAGQPPGQPVGQPAAASATSKP